MLKVKVTKCPFQTGGAVPETEGVPHGQGTAELEEGEVYKDDQGGLQKIAEGAGTHDEGGVEVDDAHKVLEDTADKRQDLDSKTLRMSPEEVQGVTGFKSDKSLSHSKAFEKSWEYYEKQIDKIQKKLKKNVHDASKYNSLYAKNSMDLNLEQLLSIPTQGELFDKLFTHQEITKKLAGIDGKQIQQQTGGQTVGFGDQSYTRAPEYPNIEIKPTRVKITKAPGPNPAPANNPFSAAHKASWQQMDAQDDLNSIKFPPINTTQADASAVPQTPPTASPVSQFPTTTSTQGTGTRGTTYPGSQQPQSRNSFNEPLRWYDVAGDLASLASSGRTPTRYNPVNLTEPQVHLLNPAPELQAGQSNYNALLRTLPSNGVGMSNLATIYASKYGIDDRILGAYENQNKQRLDQRDQLHAQIRNQQEVANQQSRETFERKQLGSMEAQRQLRLAAYNDVLDKIAQNKKLNTEGNLLMHLYPNYDQSGNFRGNNGPLVRNPSGNPLMNGAGNQTFTTTDPKTGQQQVWLKTMVDGKPKLTRVG